VKTKRAIRVPLLGVLGLRIALVAAATILLFNSIAPHLKHLGYDWLKVSMASYPEELVVARDLAAIVELGPSLTSDPSALAELAKLEARFLENDSAFYVLDRNGNLLFRSRALADVPLDVLTTSTWFRVNVDGQHAGHAWGNLTPIGGAEQRVGVLGSVNLYFTKEAAAEREAGKPEPPLLELASSDPLFTLDTSGAARGLSREARFDRVRRFVDVSVPILCALVLGGLASLLVTRRLLGMAAASRLVDAEGLPGPFDTRGSDEVAELARALEDMRTRNLELVRGLERRDAARREWVAQVSHDLRTPLTSLQVCLERVHAAAPVGADAALDEAVRLARHDAERVSTLAEDLLEAARLEGGASLNVEPLLPIEVVQQALRSVRPIASAAGTALEFEGGTPQTKEWRGDGARLVRACENLLRNAVRHARSRVSVALELHAGALRFRVRDDGSGFGGAPGPVDLRAARVIGMDVGTSGLGLLVVERIAAAHGGRFGATNLESGGAEVWFEIAEQPPAGRAQGQW